MRTKGKCVESELTSLCFLSLVSYHLVHLLQWCFDQDNNDKYGETNVGWRLLHDCARKCQSLGAANFIFGNKDGLYYIKETNYGWCFCHVLAPKDGSCVKRSKPDFDLYYSGGRFTVV